MDTDLALTVGIVLFALSVPPILSDFADSRRPWFGGGMLLVAVGLVVLALVVRPGGYRLAEVPQVMLGVFARLLN